MSDGKRLGLLAMSALGGVTADSTQHAFGFGLYWLVIVWLLQLFDLWHERRQAK